MIEHQTLSQNDDAMPHRLYTKDGIIHQTVAQTIEKDLALYSFLITMNGNPRIEYLCFHLQHISHPTRKPQIPGDSFLQSYKLLRKAHPPFVRFFLWRTTIY